MIRKLLIGPALTGAGWLAGSYYGASAEQLVQKAGRDLRRYFPGD